MAEINFHDAAIQIGKMLKDYKAEDVVVLDLKDKNIWTDYFIIATVSSATHSKGLEKHIYEETQELNLTEYRTTRKRPEGNEWRLIDLSGIVIHLMSKTARQFYDLEKLWYDSKNILES
ncbi:MAG: ribosome silencing factor [Treponema sp.]|nr:MAG: ribosome silencing factor [Treponema sp.]